MQVNDQSNSPTMALALGAAAPVEVAVNDFEGNFKAGGNLSGRELSANTVRLMRTQSGQTKLPAGAGAGAGIG